MDRGGDIADFINICEATPLWAANDNHAPSNIASSGSSLEVITEDAIASRFAEIFAPKLRYCHSTGAWFEWNDVVWCNNGLVRPQSIVTATNDYFEEQDLFGHWLEECCDVDRENHYKWERATGLLESWRDYCEAAGERPATTRSMSSALVSRGFGRKRVTGGATAYTGLVLKLRRPHSREN